jgi:hypothetical protein
MKLSLCIPTYKRFDFLIKSIPNYLENPYIDEIIITDDDGEDFELLNLYFSDNNKLKIYKNEKRLKPFLNKERAVSLCKNEWVCIIDSDNFADIDYFKSWEEHIKQNGINNKIIYCPSGTLPQGNFTFDFVLGKEVNIDNIKDFWKIHNFGVFMDIGNYIFNKEEYLYNPGNREYENMNITDVKYRNYFMLSNGCKMVAVPNMKHLHIRHENSYYSSDVSKDPNHQVIFKKLDNLFGIY